MFTPSLIASDVDGTLLSPLEKVTERTADVVTRAVGAGVPVVLVTGRPPRWIPPVAGQTGLSGYAVCSNGSTLYDIGADQVIDVQGLLDPVLLNDVAEALDVALPGCRIGAERIGTGSASQRDRGDGPSNFAIEADYSHPWGDDEGMVVPRAEVIGHPAVKLLVSHTKMTSDEMATAARASLDGVVDITFSSGSGLIELAAHGITKATGLERVARKLGVPRERTISFGDMPNDLEMLRWSGHGVAMANAHPTVLHAVDEVTASNSDDGVAQVLERWF